VSLPLSFLGKVTIPAAPEVELVANRLEQALRVLKARQVSRVGSRIEFKAGVSLAISSTNLLAPIGSGELSLHPSGEFLTVRYQLRFTQMLVLVSGMVLAISVPFLMNMRTWSDRQEGVLFLFFAWLWLFGGNVAISIVRFPRWIVRSVTGKD
jgi:hypothetical protein